MQSLLSRETIQNAFFFCFSELFPPFQLRLFILYQVPHSRALAPAWSALVSFFHNVFYSFKEKYCHMSPYKLSAHASNLDDLDQSEWLKFEYLGQ